MCDKCNKGRTTQLFHVCPSSPDLLWTPSIQVSNSRLFLAVFSVVLGNFSFGYSMVYASPVQTALQSSEDPRLRMGPTQYAWFGAIYSLGAAAGGLATMLLNDIIGRKMSIMTSAMPSAVGWVAFTYTAPPGAIRRMYVWCCMCETAIRLHWRFYLNIIYIWLHHFKQ